MSRCVHSWVESSRTSEGVLKVLLSCSHGCGEKMVFIPLVRSARSRRVVRWREAVRPTGKIAGLKALIAEAHDRLSEFEGECPPWMHQPSGCGALVCEYAGE